MEVLVSQTIISLVSDLPLVWHQAIIWTNAELLSIVHLGINSSKILIKI